MSLYDVAPCTRGLGDPEPGVRLLRMGDMLNRLTAAEARSLGADLILAANTSEAQWDASAMRQRDPDNDHRFEAAGVDGYEL